MAKFSVPFIWIQPKPVDISIPNPGPTGNPFTNWTPPQGNFGDNSGVGTPSRPPSFVPPPNISAPSFPSSGTPKPMIDTSHIPVQSSSTLSRSSGDFSDQHLDSATVSDISLSDGCYDLVSFHNNTIGYKGIDQLLFNQSRMSLHPEKGSIYQGMLARPGMNIVKLDLSHCSIGSLGSGAIGEAIYGDSSLRFLQHLNLSNNSIDDSGIYAFGNAWFCKTSPCLRSLDLSNNLLTDNGAQSLSWSFKKGNFYYLKHLDVSGNKITEKGENFFVKALKDPTVQHIAVLLEDLGQNLKIQSGRKEDVVPELHRILHSAEKRGVDVQHMVVDLSFLTWYKNLKGMATVATRGFIKCKWTEDPIGDWAKDSLAAKLPKSIQKPLKKFIDSESTVSCFIKSYDQAITSEFGAQTAINDLHIIGESYVPESFE